MTVLELITQLQACNPAADVMCWARDENGECLDDVANVVQLASVWAAPTDTTVFLTVKVNTQYIPSRD